MGVFYVENETDAPAAGHTFVGLYQVPSTAKALFIRSWSARWVYGGSVGAVADSVRWGYSSAGTTIDTECDASLFLFLPENTSSTATAPYANGIVVPPGKWLTIDIFIGAAALGRLSNAFHGVLT